MAGASWEVINSPSEKSKTNKQKNNANVLL